MTDVEAWMPLKAAIEQVTQSHDLSDLKPSEAFQRSVTALHSALAAGVVMGRSATVNWYRRDRLGGSHLEDAKTDYLIPPSTWGLPLTGTLMEWSMGSLSAMLPLNKAIRLGGIEIEPISLNKLAPIATTNTDAPLDNESRPRLSDLAFDRWWTKMCDSGAADVLGQKELMWIVQGAHPNNSVARKRVEAVTAGRKRGPKSSSPAK